MENRSYPSLQKMFNAARASGLALFVREGYRTFRDQKQIMNEKIRDYENQGNFKWQAARMAEKYVAIPGTSEHELGGVWILMRIRRDVLRKKCIAGWMIMRINMVLSSVIHRINLISRGLIMNRGIIGMWEGRRLRR